MMIPAVTGSPLRRPVQLARQPATGSTTAVPSNSSTERDASRSALAATPHTEAAVNAMQVDRVVGDLATELPVQIGMAT
ncbi:MAG: hypothetical protein CMM46_12510 [Rhodospirillaceae bacterium]|nr:hypothetical protein [Rhodospirillaceae bacterium]